MSKKQRNLAFQSLRNQGIKKFNAKQMLKEKPMFLRSRSAHKGTGQRNELVMCDVCECFISRGFFYRHRRRCSDGSPVSCPIAASVLSRLTSTFSEDFNSKILANLKDDAVGIICKADSGILFFGSRLFEKLKRKKDKDFQVRNTVKQDTVRRMGTLFLHLQSCIAG